MTKKKQTPLLSFNAETAELVRDLAALQCAVEEICAVTHIKLCDMHRLYRTYIDAGRKEGLVKLRRMQWESARMGSVTMQIWLGKVLLGQRDDKPTSTCLPEVKKLIDYIEGGVTELEISPK